MKLKNVAILVMLVSTIQTGLTYGFQKELEAIAKEKEKIDQRAYEIEKNKQINISVHAQKQMNKRGISRGEVEKTIKYGTKSVNKRDGSVKFLRKNIMVVTDLDEKVVITVYLSDKDERILSAKERSLNSKIERTKRKQIRSETPETRNFVRSLKK